MIVSTRLSDDDPVSFLTISQVDSIHSACLMPGNLTGYLKRVDLESALGRPEQHYNYGERDLIRLAAVLWHGISCAHGFNDGNKRTGLTAAFVFLQMHGVEWDPSVTAEEPGAFTDACFQQNRFTLDVLEHYLRTRCRWIVGD